MSSRDGLGSLPRRRNGKLQSCEACRKAKIACDHTLPVCDRCKRRKISSKCVYVDAPMTRNAAGGSKESNFNRPLTPITGSSASPGASEISKPILSKPAAESGPFIKSGSYFGPTNFSAVFLENRENLGNDIQISNDSDSYDPPHESCQSQAFLMLAGNEFPGDARVALGVKVLRKLPDKATCNFLLDWYFEKCHECCFHKPSVMATADSIWKTFGDHLKEPRRLVDLEDISTILYKNNETPLPEFDDYEPWLESFIGTKMRWESLGSVFCALANATLSLPERDAFFSTQRGLRSNRKHFAVEMKDCVQACIALSNHMDFINMQMVALLAKNLILQTVISGDTSLLVWRQLGDLVSASTALGLHRDVDAARPRSFVSELKRSLFTVIFNIDKGTSLLTGRPPALSHRYTRFKFPIDVSDDVVMRGGQELAKAVEKIDANGWNTEGKIYSATWIRAHGILAIVLNEILELSLGDLGEGTDDRIKHLIDRVDQTYASFPSFIRWNQDDANSAVIPDDVFWKQLSLRLNVLEHRLLLERLAYKRGLLDGQSMVDCAREMLELTVLIWVQRDRFVEHHHDYDWMLMCWGVPSSGVLCVELLKQMKLPPGTPQIPILPRSEIVQNLSLLIGFLEWIRPAAGNYQLCGRMRQIIKRILDQILNPSPPSSQESLRLSQQQNFDSRDTNAVEAFDTSFFDPGSYGDGLENLDWLNSVDWSRGPWIDLGAQNYSTARWNY